MRIFPTTAIYRNFAFPRSDKKVFYVVPLTSYMSVTTKNCSDLLFSNIINKNLQNQNTESNLSKNMSKYEPRKSIYVLGIVIAAVVLLSTTMIYYNPPVQDVPKFTDRRKHQVRVSVNSEIALSQSMKTIYEQICLIDKEKTDLIKNIDFQSTTNDELRDLFHQIIMNPHIGRCTTLQRFGGFYRSDCKYWDGQKFMCMPDVYEDIENNECLIYSFGIANDYSFEQALGLLGCKVFTFDPYVRYPPKIAKNVYFEKLGVANRNDPPNLLKTLSSIFSAKNHSNTKITYLKIDIEGNEIDGLDEWLKSGALDNVQQIALEYHLEDTISTMNLFKALLNLYFVGDYRLISFDLNGCGRNQIGHYIKFAEIVLMKTSKQSPCIERVV